MPPDTDQTEIIANIRLHLAGRGEITEKRIVGGGIGFMVDGHLCCGLSPRGLTVRVGPDGKTDALSQPHVRPLTLGSRETAAFVVVEPDGYRDPIDLARWVDEGLRFVSTLTE